MRLTSLFLQFTTLRGTLNPANYFSYFRYLLRPRVEGIQGTSGELRFLINLPLVFYDETVFRALGYDPCD